MYTIIYIHIYTIPNYTLSSSPGHLMALPGPPPAPGCHQRGAAKACEGALINARRHAHEADSLRIGAEIYQYIYI